MFGEFQDNDFGFICTIDAVDVYLVLEICSCKSDQVPEKNY